MDGFPVKRQLCDAAELLGCWIVHHVAIKQLMRKSTEVVFLFVIPLNKNLLLK